MRYSSRFFLYGPFFLFVAMAAGVMIYWWMAATALSQRLDALNGHEVAPGIHMSFASKRIAGFPFRVDAIFEDFSLNIAGTRGPMIWRTDHFATHMFTYQTSQAILEAAGRQKLSWTGETGRQRTVIFTPGSLRASAIFDGSTLARFDVDSFALALPKFAAARAQFHLRRDPADANALDLVLDLLSVHFAGDAAAGFPKGLTQARIEGRLSPAAPFKPVLAGTADWRPTIEKWRTAPGSFKIDEAAFSWGRCEATSSGLVTLDDAHRLSGSLAFSLANCNALERQAANVTATHGAHRAILTVLAGLATRASPGRNGAIPVRLVFKDGLLFAGPGTANLGSFFEPIGFLHPLY
jgi:hypothetical protein